MTFYILPATGVLMVAHIKDHPWSPIIFRNFPTDALNY